MDPSPWHAWGKATFTFIFRVSFDFDARFGQQLPQTSVPRIDPWDEHLKPAIEEASNWSTSLPVSAQQVVSIAEPHSDQPINLLDPLGEITFRQKAVPLNRKLTKFGEAELSGPRRYDIDKIKIGKNDARWEPIQDHFAPAQFEQMSNAEKLSRPSFEKMAAGVKVGGNDCKYGVALPKELIYETSIIDAPWKVRSDKQGPKEAKYHLPEGHQEQMAIGGAAAFSLLKTSGNARYMPPANETSLVGFADEQYVIVNTDDLSQTNIAAPTTKGAAFQALDDYLAEHPEQCGKCQVIPICELKEMV